MADFTGFYFGGIHSSTYGLLRVSDGDRYTEGLIPDFDDQEIELVGGTGSLYCGRRLKKTSFSISVAFDHVTEQQFRDMRNWLGGEELKEFRFDERPYKAYWAKLASRPELNYICFMEPSEDSLRGGKERIYKGEGELEFIAYDPMGYCIDETVIFSPLKKTVDKTRTNWQSLDKYAELPAIRDNLTEWATSAGLKNEIRLKDYNIFSMKPPYTAKIYNPGDRETDFQLLVKGSDLGKTSMGISILSEGETTPQIFMISRNGIPASDVMTIDTKKHMISLSRADNGGHVTTDLRYDLVKSPSWIKIPKGESTMTIISTEPFDFIEIKYNYIYY